MIIKRKSVIAGVGISNVGKKRENNEDNFIIGNIYNRKSEMNMEVNHYAFQQGKWYCIAVFDGMGGIDNGEMASLYAAEEFYKIQRKLAGRLSHEYIDKLARMGFFNANRRIVDKGKSGMIGGTTGTVLFTNGDEFKIYHMGDSRAYLMREKELIQLTKDQTLAALKIEAGFYEEDDQRVKADKHRLTEYIGMEKSDDSLNPQESEWIEFRKGDKLLLCSDGLYDMCSDEEIKEVLLGIENENIGSKLVEKALENGGADNITCMLLVK